MSRSTVVICQTRKFRGILLVMEVKAMKKKSRVEILRGKLRRMGESDDVHPEMPEEVASSFLAHVRFDPDCGAIAARSWSPTNRNQQPWIAEMLKRQPVRRSPIAADDVSEEPVN